ncbi:MAG TPA: protein-glutamate O-methyltransferase CheR [Bryobacteraceae bacterium]|nr:protein-glutamate O-methyltransferase CheR [Bryobacteraceae bacterium]
MGTQPPAARIRAECYRFLQEHVYSQAGIVVEEDKHYLFESRLTPIVRQLGLGSINELCALLAATREPEISRRVAEAMTTNETYFFRDPEQYEAIREVLLPRLREERREARRLRFWSAAASTGQEAYSLAMVLREEGFGDWDVQILATDYSSQVLERARAGSYRQIEVSRGLPAGMLAKYFERSGADWQIDEDLRRMVRFETFDLRESMRVLGLFDLVFCRNVMIYFDAETRNKMLRELRGTLFRGGWLLLGGTEVACGIEAWFRRQMVRGVNVYAAC